MASPGHRPIANTDPERSRRTLESAPLGLTSKTSLPYYRRRRPAVPKRDRLLEALVEGAETGEAADDVLVDVAAASFGAKTRVTDPVVFEVVSVKTIANA